MLLITFLRIYVGYKWVTAGWGKLIDGFDASGFLHGAINKSSGDYPVVQDWWASFLQHGVIPKVEFFNILIPMGEFLVGLGLIFGTFTTIAALMGLVMNSSFLLSGASSISVHMLLIEVLIITAATNGGKIGLDRFLLPYLSTLFSKKNKGSTNTNNQTT